MNATCIEMKRERASWIRLSDLAAQTYAPYARKQISLGREEEKEMEIQFAQSEKERERGRRYIQRQFEFSFLFFPVRRTDEGSGTKDSRVHASLKSKATPRTQERAVERGEEQARE